MVAEADLHLSENCPSIDDEATVWAGKRIQSLEKLLRQTQHKTPNYEWVEKRDVLLSVL
jgi:hypothetical protein